MTELERIKDEVAKEQGFDSWEDVDMYAIDCRNEAMGTPDNPFADDLLNNEICKRYAKACVEASLKKAAFKADVTAHEIPIERGGGYQYVVDQSSILDPSNIIIL